MFISKKKFESELTKAYGEGFSMGYEIGYGEGFSMGYEIGYGDGLVDEPTEEKMERVLKADKKLAELHKIRLGRHCIYKYPF